MGAGVEGSEEDLREGVDHGRHRRLVPGADVVEVQHALHRPGLHPPHDGLGVTAEQGGGLGWERDRDPREMVEEGRGEQK